MNITLSDLARTVSLQIEETHEAFHGPAGEGRAPNPTLVTSAPGQGRDTAIRAASMEAAERLGLIFVEGADVATTAITPNHFVFVRQSPADASAPFVPGSASGLATDLIAKASQAGASAIVLDYDTTSGPLSLDQATTELLFDRSHKGSTIGAAFVCLSVTTQPDQEGLIIPTALRNKLQVFTLEPSLLSSLSERRAAQKSEPKTKPSASV